jgi:lysozyme family protein
MNRDDCIALQLKLEGGEANLKGDPGGHTKYGITQHTLDACSAKDFTLPAYVGDLTTEQAASIYRTVQWRDIRGDNLPPALACLMLNSAVNQGTPTAIHMLQDCLGVPVDGILGPATLAAVPNWRSRYMPEQTLVEEFAAHVAARYAQLYGSESQFELGWFRRLFRVYTLTVSS